LHRERSRRLADEARGDARHARGSAARRRDREKGGPRVNRAGRGSQSIGEKENRTWRRGNNPEARFSSMSNLTGDAEAAMEFLSWLRPRGLHALTAIDPDTRSIETRTFAPEARVAVRGWISRWCGSHNLYYSVNAVDRELHSKATKADISAIEF